jgi:CRP-like cAMP-binding protein
MDAHTPLGDNRILHSLPAETLDAFKQITEHIPLHRGSIVYLAGSAIEHVYFPTAGMISLLAVMKSGRQIETGIVGRAGVVGASIANGGPLAFGQATVQIEGGAWKIPSAAYLKLFESSAPLRKVVNEFEGFLYFQAQQSSGCNSAHTPEARLCRWILQSQDVLQSDTINLTEEFVSHMLAVPLNAAALSANLLQKAGLIEYTNGAIKIISREGIAASACECYETIHEFTKRMDPPFLAPKSSGR